LSAVDTLTGVLIGLLGSVPVALVVYLLDERREKNRVRRETALRPLPEKESALKDLYYALVDFTLSAIKVQVGTVTDGKNIGEALDRFTVSIAHAALWMSGSIDNLQRLLDADRAMARDCVNLLEGRPAPKDLFDDFMANYGTVSSVIAKELRIQGLENQLLEIGGILR
jgi:hypothetical protein